MSSNTTQQSREKVEIRIKPETIELSVRSVDQFFSKSNDVLEKFLGPRHNKLFPNTIRSIICGPSGCGKTNLIFVLLTHKNGLRYKNVYILSKSLQQEKYELLRALYTKVPEIKAFFCSNEDELPDPQNCLPDSIIIIDDVLCLKKDKDKIRMYFCYGRHKNLDTFYLYQTYTHIDKHLLRDNCNLIILFQQDELNLHQVDFGRSKLPR